MSFLKNFDFITVFSSPEAISPALEWLQEQSRFFYLKEYDLNAEYFTWAFIVFVLVALFNLKIMKNFNKTQDERLQKLANLVGFIKKPLFLILIYSIAIKSLFVIGLYITDYRAKSLLNAPFYQELDAHQQDLFRSYMKEYAEEKQDDNGRTYYTFDYFDISGVLKRMADNGEIQSELAK